MISFRDKISKIVIQKTDDRYSFIEYHLLYFKESIADLKKEEHELIRLLRDINNELIGILEAILSNSFPSIFKLVTPKVEYHSSYSDKERYMEVLFPFGNIECLNKEWKMFEFGLNLRPNEGMHSIDHGLFDLEFSALGLDPRYYGCFRTVFKKRITLAVSLLLPNISTPLSKVFEKVTNLKLGKIAFSDVKKVEYSMFEGNGGALQFTGVAELSGDGSREEKDIFICHASDDKPKFVDPLVNKMNSINVSYWYDLKEIKWGDKIATKINEGLSNVKFVMVVLSINSLKKDWQKTEIDSALNMEISNGKTKVLPIIIGDDQSRNQIVKAFPLINSKRYLKWDNEPFDEILTNLKDILNL